MKNDNSSEIKNFPDVFFDTVSHLDSTEIKWTCPQGDCSGLMLEYGNHGVGVQLREKWIGGGPKYIIEIYVGDPDTSEPMIFEKE